MLHALLVHLTRLTFQPHFCLLKHNYFLTHKLEFLKHTIKTYLFLMKVTIYRGGGVVYLITGSMQSAW